MQAITDEEVEHRRNAERRQLFLYAQGTKPWWYRGTAIVFMLIYSILLSFLGIIFLVFSSMNLSKYGWGSIWIGMAIGILFVIAGLYYLLQTIDRAKTAAQLAKLSSQELALRLESGEVTKGE